MKGTTGQIQAAVQFCEKHGARVINHWDGLHAPSQLELLLGACGLQIGVQVFCSYHGGLTAVAGLLEEGRGMIHLRCDPWLVKTLN